MRYIYIILRILVGLLFIFSGYVKAVDPWGSAIKFGDYLDAMGLHLLNFLSFPLANFLNIIELLTGYLLVFHLRMRWASRAALLLTLLFLPLTLWLAVTGKVTDCGCFGDAIKISDWGTFWKNVLLLIPVIIITIYHKKFPSKIAKAKQRLLFLFGLLFSAGVIYYSYQHLPLIDFRPYKTGTNIVEDMTIPEDAPVDEYKTTFKYEKDGVVKEFDENNYPWQDSTWTFVSSEQQLLKKGYTPPIHDFVIETEYGENITSAILENNRTLLIISHKLEKTNFAKIYTKGFLQATVQQATKEKIPVYLITSSTSQQVENIKTFIPEPIIYASADDKMLETIIRANPGLVLLNEGIIVGKWSYNDIPREINFLNKSISQAPQAAKSKIFNSSIRFSIILFIILTIITLVIIKVQKNEKKSYRGKLENE